MVRFSTSLPERGDIVSITLNPQAGHEQTGRRPALVLSSSSYNRKVGLAVFCPVTSQIKGYPFEVLLPGNIDVQGVVLSDQIKSLDWRVRNVKLICTLPPETVNEVLQKIHALLFE
jgi:mRNA interferase MazF